MTRSSALIWGGNLICLNQLQIISLKQVILANTSSVICEITCQVLWLERTSLKNLIYDLYFLFETGKHCNPVVFLNLCPDYIISHKSLKERTNIV